MRCILVVLDGLGDKGISEAGNKTPLQMADTPNLDAIAASGINGLYHPDTKGVAMPSEMAHFSIFGYDNRDFPGRGYLEAEGKGIITGLNDVAILGRIFNVKNENSQFLLKHEKIDLPEEQFLKICHDISYYTRYGIDLEVIPTGGIGGIVTLKGNVSPDITDSNPIIEEQPIIRIKPLEISRSPEKASKTAEFLNEYTLWTYSKLSVNPVNLDRKAKGLPELNIVGLQRAGQKKEVAPFRTKWGLNALCIASGSIYHGLCSFLGMDIKKVADTGQLGKDLKERLKLALEATDHDLVYVHSKAPDEAAHKKDFKLKREVIEELDRAMGYALDHIIPDEEILLVITSDHSTASKGSMIHSGETVPLVMKGKYTRKDEVIFFNEISASRGGLGDMRGHEIMYMILNLLDRGKLKGLMDTPEDQPYTPGTYEPLRFI